MRNETKRRKRTPAALKIGAYSASNWVGPARHDPGAATGRAQEKPGKTGPEDVISIQLSVNAQDGMTQALSPRVGPGGEKCLRNPTTLSLFLSS